MDVPMERYVYFFKQYTSAATLAGSPGRQTYVLRHSTGLLPQVHDVLAGTGCSNATGNVIKTESKTLNADVFLYSFVSCATRVRVKKKIKFLPWPGVFIDVVKISNGPRRP